MENYNFTIEGKVYSKKNNKRVFVRNGRPIITTSKAYQESLAYIEPQIVIQKNRQNISDPLEGDIFVSMAFVLGDKRKRDLDNMVTSILDILQDCGVIKDDSFVIDISATKFYSKGDFQVKISLKN